VVPQTRTAAAPIPSTASRSSASSWPGLSQLRRGRRNVVGLAGLSALVAALQLVAVVAEWRYGWLATGPFVFQVALNAMLIAGSSAIIVFARTRADHRSVVGAAMVGWLVLVSGYAIGAQHHDLSVFGHANQPSAAMVVPLMSVILPMPHSGDPRVGRDQRADPAARARDGRGDHRSGRAIRAAARGVRRRRHRRDLDPRVPPRAGAGRTAGHRAAARELRDRGSARTGRDGGGVPRPPHRVGRPRGAQAGARRRARHRGPRVRRGAGPAVRARGPRDRPPDVAPRGAPARLRRGRRRHVLHGDGAARRVRPRTPGPPRRPPAARAGGLPAARRVPRARRGPRQGGSSTATSSRRTCSCAGGASMWTS
jgi:hypothetical protein